MTTPGGDTVALGSLNVEQLQGIHRSTEQEVQYLTDSLKQLGGAQQRLNASRRCANEIGAAQVGREMLVPLTSSVYVNGELGDNSSVMVDLGTGYYVEKSPEEAEEYFNRRIALIRDQMDKAQTALTQKRQMLEALTQVLQRKLQAQQQAAGAAAATGTAAQ